MGDDKDDKKDQKKGQLIRLSDFRRGDLSGEWQGVVQSVSEVPPSDKLIDVRVADFMAAESYWLSNPVLYRAGRNTIQPGDTIAFKLSEKTEAASELGEAAGFVFHRITSLRFVP